MLLNSTQLQNLILDRFSYYTKNLGMKEVTIEYDFMTDTITVRHSRGVTRTSFSRLQRMIEDDTYKEFDEFIYNTLKGLVSNDSKTR